MCAQILTRLTHSTLVFFFIRLCPLKTYTFAWFPLSLFNATIVYMPHRHLNIDERISQLKIAYMYTTWAVPSLKSGIVFLIFHKLKLYFVEEYINGIQQTF